MADELYRKREQPGAVQESISTLMRTPGGRREYGVNWRLARALFFIGQTENSAVNHAAGVTAGRQAVELEPGGVEGRFWLGVNLALLAESTGGLKGAVALLNARSQLVRAAAICEGYHGAGPLRVLGRLEHKAPWFLGGNRKRSLRYLDRALSLAPENSVTLMYAARLAIDLGDPGRAAALLQRVVETRADPDWLYEVHRDRALARAMLAEMARKKSAER
jgi:hypothetical protein